MLEQLLARHCGPALAGIKPGNIVSVSKTRYNDIENQISELNGQLNGKDIYVRILCSCERRALVLVYRRKVLTEYLSRPEISKLLEDFGYKRSASLEQKLKMLKSRLSEREFPHEIGAFLGYPAHDIYGFINHKDDGCLLTGEWKVYAEPEAAARMFRRYKLCRLALLKRVQSGLSLSRIFHAA